MSAVVVRRLSLQASRQADVAPGRALVEEALRLASSDLGDKVIVLRRLDLGEIEPGRPFAAQRLGERIAARLRAGLDDGDAAVFATPHAARAALAAVLAAGTAPVGWWWRAAVPDWKDTADAAAADAAILAALASPEGRAALAFALRRAGLATSAVEAGNGAPLRCVQPAERAASIAPGLSQALAVRALAAWPGVRVADGAAAPAVFLALMGAVAASPPLAAARPAARAVASAALARLQVIPASETPETRRETARTTPEPEGPAATDAPLGHARAGPTAANPAAVATSPTLVPASAAAGCAAPQMPAARADRPGEAAVPMLAPPALGLWRERMSPLAGVLLLPRALDRLGLGRLATRAGEDVAAAAFGRRLLARIAHRHGVTQDDPLAALLGGIEPLEQEDAQAAAWRVGLDRYLRRRCGLRLADVARRRGWLAMGDAVCAVRFPLRAADIRLRRHALDVDPGFVPWLGFRLAYRFDDGASP